MLGFPRGREWGQYNYGAPPRQESAAVTLAVTWRRAHLLIPCDGRLPGSGRPGPENLGRIDRSLANTGTVLEDSEI